MRCGHWSKSTYDRKDKLINSLCLHSRTRRHSKKFKTIDGHTEWKSTEFIVLNSYINYPCRRKSISLIGQSFNSGNRNITLKVFIVTYNFVMLSRRIMSLYTSTSLYGQNNRNSSRKRGFILPLLCCEERPSGSAGQSACGEFLASCTEPEFSNF
jgi:hypothetical protein